MNHRSLTIWRYRFQLALIWAAMSAVTASAQDRISVPLKDPSRPATLVVNLLGGAVTVKGYSGKEILLELPERRSHRIPEGMHRVDTGLAGLEAVEENNVVTVRAGSLDRSRLIIQVPVNTSLKLRQTDGRVDIEEVAGEIDVNTSNGNIVVGGATAAVLAHSNNGRIAVSFRQLPTNKPVNLSTMNGAIDLTLPADSKAKLVMKTENGDIVTDFDLKIDASVNTPVVDDKRDRGGNYHVSRGRSLTGTINGGGGGDIEITSYNGRVVIGKAK